MNFDQLWLEIETSIPKSMTMNEYKDYILGLFFYRYLCMYQESYLIENNVIEVICNKTINDVFSEVAKGDNLCDYLEDISSSLGYAIEPKYMWKSIINSIDENKIVPEDFQIMFEKFNNNATLNKSAGKNFKDIFADVKVSDTRLGSDSNSRAHSLIKTVKIIDGIADDDVNGVTFSCLIENFANMSGKKGGKFYTPQSVSKLMAKLVTSDFKTTDSVFSVYDLACGSGSSLISVKEEVPGGERIGAIKLYGEEIELTTYNLARMNLFINKVSSNNIVLNRADTLDEDWPDGIDDDGNIKLRKFDAIVSDIEFSRKWNNNSSKMKDPRFKEYGKLAPASKADYAFILHGLYHLDDEGTMVVVVPHGVLFREKSEEIIRKNLINHPSGNKIYAVVGLPENIMFAEKGKKSVAISILILKKKRTTRDILFIDASRDFVKGKKRNELTEEHILKICQTYNERKDIPRYAHLADYSEIEKNEFNLNIARYVDNTEEQQILDPLEICNLIAQDEVAISSAKEKVNEYLHELGMISEC